MRAEPVLGLAMLILASLAGPWAHKSPDKETLVTQGPPSVGAKAPDFTLPSSEGGTLSLSALKGKVVVLYFYPKDNTPGCTREACSFRDERAEIAKRGAVVLGVSRDSLESHAKFTNRHNLNFPLLSDPDGTVLEAYGCWKPYSIFGRTALGVNRSTFLIDQEGVIRKIWRGVNVKGHDQDVLAAVDSLAPGNGRG